MINPQTPAEGIMLSGNYSDCKFYKITCTCGDDAHNIDVSISYDKDIGDVVIEFYSKQKSLYWEKVADWDTYKIHNTWLYSIAYFIKSFINGFGHRLKVTYNLWWNGYLEYQSDTIMSKQTALNFAEALKNTVLEIDKNEKIN